LNNIQEIVLLLINCFFKLMKLVKRK